LRDLHKTKHGFIISHALNISNKEWWPLLSRVSFDLPLLAYSYCWPCLSCLILLNLALLFNLLNLSTLLVCLLAFLLV
jgi:hypothetical protein